MSTNHGSCDCGNIEYEFQDEPINTVFCYCKTCQLHTNSDKWFGVWVPFDKFKLVKGTPSSFTALGDSGSETHRLFCGDCSTVLGLSVMVLTYILYQRARLPVEISYCQKCLFTPR